jgi:hypothetical protein
MLAIAAAVVFGFALLLDLFNTRLGAPDLLSPGTLQLLGFLLLALYLGGVGTGPRVGAGRGFRGRRPGRG